MIDGPSLNANDSEHAQSAGNRPSLLVVAGLTKKNLHPRVWDPTSPYYLPNLRAVMISYADFHRRRSWRDAAMAVGLRAYLEVPDHISIYLDNGAFYFLSHTGDHPRHEYEEFVLKARPDWHPIPLDFIPTPSMSTEDQRVCFERTMEMNRAYRWDGFVPVAHISAFLEEYTAAIRGDEELWSKPSIALGGIVPNLLRATQAQPYGEILTAMQHVRQAFLGKDVHVFGIGGTATLHLAALLGMDSVDSSGWRNRAARGLIQLPGTGDRIVADLGSWRGRRVSPEEWLALESCACPPCRQFGATRLASSGLTGASHRAAHNLWVLLNEASLIEDHLADDTYREWYRSHLTNTIYTRLIDRAVEIYASGQRDDCQRQVTRLESPRRGVPASASRPRAPPRRGA